MDELIYASAAELAAAIRTKQVSSEEVVEAYLQRIEAVNPRLNAVVQAEYIETASGGWQRPPV